MSLRLLFDVLVESGAYQLAEDTSAQQQLIDACERQDQVLLQEQEAEDYETH